MASAGFIVLLAALVAALLREHSRRRRAERAARCLGRRLVNAHEDERRRLARDLHDDISQRLAALAIRIAVAETDADAARRAAAARSVREGLAGLGEDGHGLSHRLHPTVIEGLGLVEALRAECDRVARSEPIQVELEAGGVPAGLAGDAAVGLFRVAQEALHNVVRHARASEVRVALLGGKGRLVLAVHDNGRGIRSVPRVAGSSGLGMASMRERMSLLDGRLDVHSAPGCGTTITASVPMLMKMMKAEAP